MVCQKVFHKKSDIYNIFQIIYRKTDQRYKQTQVDWLRINATKKGKTN